MDDDGKTDRFSLANIVLDTYSGVPNISVGRNNCVGKDSFPKFNKCVGDLLIVM